MKKILIRVLSVILIFLVVVAGTAGYLLFHEPAPEDAPIAGSKPTIVDANGDPYLLVVDGNGTSYAVVTDADGNRYAAEYSGNQIGATVGSINNDVALDEVPTTTPKASVTIPPASYDTPVAPTVPSTTAPQATPTAPAKNNPDSAYRIEMCEKIFASGTYLMEITTNDAELGETPITMAIKNGNMYVDTTIEGLKCQMLYTKSNDTMYLIFDEWKKYCKLPEDLMGEDFDMGSMVQDFGVTDIGKITVENVELDGKKVIRESYVSTADGTTVNYYFDGDNLIRRDNVSKNGTVDSIYISRFMADVPDSYFQIPEGYGYLNLSWLGALM